jgi:hypothetical protein
VNVSDVVVSAHQINFLPGCSVIDRLRRADVVIWLDACQYVRHGFVNRNRLSDGAWMTIPVNEHDTYAPINRVRIADETGRKREKIARHLEHHLGDEAAPFAAELRKPYRLLAGLNHALTERLFNVLGIEVEHRFQTFLDPDHAVFPVVGEDAAQVSLVRDRYADMAAQVGATVYLSGPQAYHGDLATFAERGIRVEYTEHWTKPNPSAIELLREPIKAAA